MESKIMKSLFMFVDERLRNVYYDHNIFFSDWMETTRRDSMLPFFQYQGYKKYVSTNPFGRGNLQVWLKDVVNGKIGSESIDHYCSVLRIVGQLIINDVKIISTNHYFDVDIVCQFGKKYLAIEYERAGSHNKKEIIAKYERAKNEYGNIVFVCETRNYNDLICAIGQQNVFCRGYKLEDNLMSALYSIAPK